MSDLSVLLPVHAGTPAHHLGVALASLAAQTVPAPVLIVADGPLTASHDEVIERATGALDARRLQRPRGGLTAALNAGLAAATTTWVARMDADDVAEPHRLARQVEVLAAGGTDVLGSTMLEFADDPQQPYALRSVPLDHSDIVHRMRTRNPVNHPTVVYRRTQVIDAGGYRTVAGLEDYDLWARLAAGGLQFANLAEPLVRYRVDRGLFERRGGREQLRAEVALQHTLLGLGLVGRPRAGLNLAARIGYRLLPPVAMRQAYRVVRR